MLTFKPGLVPRSGFAVRAGMVATADRSSIVVRNLGTALERGFSTPWAIDAIALSADAGHLLAIGDNLRRGVAWNLETGRDSVQLGSVDQPSGTLRAEFCRAGATTFVIATEGMSKLVATDLSAPGSSSWVGLDGMIAFRCEGIRDIGSGWLGILGYRAGEQYDSVLTIPFSEFRSSEIAIQNALLDQSTLRDSGDRLAIGPAGSGEVVVLRDAEALEEDPEGREPDGPVDGFKGLCFWDIETTRLVERIEYDGPFDSTAQVGGDALVCLVQCRSHVDVVHRGSGTRRTIVGDRVAIDQTAIMIATWSGETCNVLTREDL